MGDEIEWMKLESNGKIRDINNENGLFGVEKGK